MDEEHAAADGSLRLTIDGVDPVVIDPANPTSGDDLHHTQVRPLPASAADRADGRRRYEVVVQGWRFEVTVEAAAHAALRERASRGEREAGHGAREQIRARIPGRVVRVWVAPGDVVEAGQRLLAVEAMKMENEIRSSRPGTVESVAVAAGQTVELGDELVVVGASRERG